MDHFKPFTSVLKASSMERKASYPDPPKFHTPITHSWTWWEWFSQLFPRFERVPYSNRIHMVTSSDKLKICSGGCEWKLKEEEYKLKLLPPTHPQSVRVQSVLTHLVQAMHSGLVLKQDCNVSLHGSESISVVTNMAGQECRNRPNKSTIKYGTKHLEGLNWEVMVVQSQEFLTSYTPRGKILISTGVLEFLKSDAELAHVLGHEVGHGVARHPSENIIMAILCGLLLLPLSMYFRRRIEFEADFMGLMLMASAGYDPQDAVNLRERCREYDYEERWLDPHPNHERRDRFLKGNKVIGEAKAIYKAVRSGQRVKCFV